MLTNEQYEAQLAQARQAFFYSVGLMTIVPEAKQGFLQEAFQFLDIQVSAMLVATQYSDLIPTKAVLGAPSDNFRRVALQVWIDSVRIVAGLAVDEDAAPKLTEHLVGENWDLTPLGPALDCFEKLLLNYDDAFKFRVAADEFVVRCEQYAKEVGHGLEPIHYKDFTRAITTIVCK